MPWKVRSSFINCAAILFRTVLLFAAVVQLAAVDNARWGANYFPNVILTTQDGARVRFYDDVIKGKIVVIDLIYTHCVDSCPLETARLVQVQKLLGNRVGKDIFFISISIDPTRDTPRVLKEYAEKYHVGPGWTLLTGKKADIELISKKLGLYTPPDPNDRDGHAPVVLVGNEPNGQWVRDSATDNARFLANMIGGWLDNWKTARATVSKTPATTYVEGASINIENKGRYIFATQCAACHTIGHGEKIGPDLAGITNVRERTWLKRFITTPDKLIAAGDPLAIELFKKYKEINMPNLRLAQEDVDALVDYMADPGASDRGVPAQTQPVEQGAVLPSHQ